ncbi:hypothetical protein OEZ86_000764 [Tetradesmus obliquus]|nr:hypothetical protein OEZ86_000764 [Tetradesmus obliquus]
MCVMVVTQSSLLLAVLLAAVAFGDARNTAGSYVISVEHQTLGGQRYPRAAHGKAMSFFIGRADKARPYDFTINTASSVLLMTCRTGPARANCPAGLPASDNYVLQAANAVKGSNCSSIATGVGCPLPDPLNNRCFASEPVTNPGIAPLFQGGCSGSGRGLTAGWSFGSNNAVSNGGVPAAGTLAVPEQLFRAGAVSNRVMGFCYLQPQKDNNCRGRLRRNSAVVLGPAVPKDLTDTILPVQTYSAPLLPAVLPKQVPGAAFAYANTYMSLVTSASVPVYLRPNMTQGPWSQNFTGTAVSFNPGEHSMLTVPTPVYTAFLDYYNQAAVKARSDAAAQGLTIQRCPAPVEQVCGMASNAPHTCQQVSMATDDPSKLATATMLLLSMYPSINITLQGGAAAEVATAIDLKLCDGDGSTGVTQGVAVCSYVLPAPEGDQGFGLGAPWFTGKFVQFDVSGAAPGYAESVGKVTWSDPINSCMF